MLTKQTDMRVATIDQPISAPASAKRARTRRHPRIPPLTMPRAICYSLASVGAGMVFAFFNAQLPLYLRDYGVPYQLIGPLTNERSFAGAFVLPIVGRWSDRARTRWGKRKPFFALGIPLMAAALVLLGLHPPFWVMLPVVLVAGGFLFIALGPYQALMADITPMRQRGMVGSLMALAGMVGAVLVAVLGGLFWQDHEFVVFCAIAGMLLLTFTLTFLTVREPAQNICRPDAPETNVRSAVPAERTPDDAAAAPPLRLLDYLRDVLRYKQTARYIAAMSLYWLAAGAATPFITLFGTEALGLSEQNANWLFLVLVLSTAVGTVLVGAVSDRLGKKRVLHVGLFVFALAALAATGVQDIWQALPVMILAGFGNACPTALGLPVLADLMPRRRSGEFIGLASFAWSIVQPFGSFMAGSLVDHYHSERWAFAFAGVGMALAVLALFAVHPPRTRVNTESE